MVRDGLVARVIAHDCGAEGLQRAGLDESGPRPLSAGRFELRSSATVETWFDGIYDAQSDRPSYAFFNGSMSIFFIFSIAAMTRFDFSGSLSCSISTKTVGTTCHETPNLSLSQPHWTSSPPAESFSQKWSTSSWVWQFTTSDIASVNLKSGPPFNAVKSCPSRSNATVMTDPFGLPAAFAASSS